MLQRRPFTPKPRPERPPVAWPGPQQFAQAARCDGAGVAQPKENVLVSEAYKNAVRSLECMRCGWPPRSQFAHSDEGKGTAIKTDDRRGWAGCGPRPDNMGCHYLVGTSGTFTKLVRRAEDERLAAKTRATLVSRGMWPKNVPMWVENPLSAQATRARVAIKSGAPT